MGDHPIRTPSRDRSSRLARRCTAPGTGLAHDRTWSLAPPSIETLPPRSESVFFKLVPTPPLFREERVDLRPRAVVHRRRDRDPIVVGLSGSRHACITATIRRRVRPNHRTRLGAGSHAPGTHCQPQRADRRHKGDSGGQALGRTKSTADSGPDHGRAGLVHPALARPANQKEHRQSCQPRCDARSPRPAPCAVRSRLDQVQHGSPAARRRAKRNAHRGSRSCRSCFASCSTGPFRALCNAPRFRPALFIRRLSQRFLQFPKHPMMAGEQVSPRNPFGHLLEAHPAVVPELDDFPDPIRSTRPSHAEGDGSIHSPLRLQRGRRSDWIRAPPPHRPTLLASRMVRATRFIATRNNQLSNLPCSSYSPPPIFAATVANTDCVISPKHPNRGNGSWPAQQSADHISIPVHAHASTSPRPAAWSSGVKSLDCSSAACVTGHSMHTR